MQPHFPAVPEPDLTWVATKLETPGSKTDVWHRLFRGKVELEQVINAYRENLCLVLDEVEQLVQNFDAEDVMITADHGQAFGEAGIYGHPEESVVNERLRELGYTI